MKLAGWLGKVGNGGGGEKWRGEEEEKGKRAKGKRGEKVHKISPFFRDGEEGKSYFAPRSNYYRQLCLLQGFCCCALNSV